MLNRLKEWVGVVFFDAYRYEKALRNSPSSFCWLEICNRGETFSKSSSGPGMKPDWRWSSQLHATQFFPSWGKRLMQKALEQYPINLNKSEYLPDAYSLPDVSFIIGHRGMDRLPLLLMTIRSIENQVNACVEIIVVEESIMNSIEIHLPERVKYLHLPIATPNQPYNRSRTFNEGAKLAVGRLLVLHDNDLLVPECYAGELLKQLLNGYQVMNLKRFVFYLTKAKTLGVVERQESIIGAPESILQNTIGGSVGIERNAFYKIGGFDEGFIGWGGEDNEFWDRAQNLRADNYGYLSMVHLWHAPQLDKKKGRGSAALERLEKQLAIDSIVRIRQLKSKGWAASISGEQNGDRNETNHD